MVKYKFADSVGSSRIKLIKKTCSSKKKTVSASQPDPLKNTSELSGCETKDDTDSNVDEGTNTHNKKVFSNKNTEKKFPEVRHLFKVTANGSVGCCSICHRDVKLSGRSDANMRSHLSNVHKMPDNLNLVVHKSFQLWTKPLEYETFL